MAALAMSAATRRLARATSGITTSDTAASTIPGRLRAGASSPTSVATGVVGDVGRKCQKAGADDSERHGLDALALAFVDVRTEAP
jgi:hypothetical protein